MNNKQTNTMLKNIKKQNNRLMEFSSIEIDQPWIQDIPKKGRIIFLHEMLVIYKTILENH